MRRFRKRIRGTDQLSSSYWHKGCFSCEVCKMTLNMKNYKGFEKRPYCNASIRGDAHEHLNATSSPKISLLPYIQKVKESEP
ncbi:hypothetical protein ILYODFUR_026589 [Ilyodon furcidens]|uniref:LIM and SH3 domain protein 1 n=1 Tax=Ilyodon furcidens TaxID=33524 RepID=A0ABV0SPF9_9TELE